MCQVQDLKNVEPETTTLIVDRVCFSNFKEPIFFLPLQIVTQTILFFFALLWRSYRQTIECELPSVTEHIKSTLFSGSWRDSSRWEAEVRASTEPNKSWEFCVCNRCFKLRLNVILTLVNFSKQVFCNSFKGTLDSFIRYAFSFNCNWTCWSRFNKLWNTLLYIQNKFWSSSIKKLI